MFLVWTIYYFICKMKKTYNYVFPSPHFNAVKITTNSLSLLQLKDQKLLGFCRLYLDAKRNYLLPDNQTFQIIKRKLCIQSPPHVFNAVVTASKKWQNKPQLHTQPLWNKMFTSWIGKNDVHTHIIFADNYLSLQKAYIYEIKSTVTDWKLKNNHQNI